MPLCSAAGQPRGQDGGLNVLCHMPQRRHCHVLQDSLESSLLSSGTPRHGVYGASSGALLRGPPGLPSLGMFPMSLPLTAGETPAASSGAPSANPHQMWWGRPCLHGSCQQ